MNDCIFIYVTNPSREEALRIARHLLDKRLIACANLLPVTSLYWWEGEIAEDEETAFIAKTLPERYDDVRREIESIHPYEVPCVVQFPVTANTPYFEWLKGEVGG